MKTAILIDGGFFTKRYRHIKGFNKTDSPETMAENLVKYCFQHLRKVNYHRSKRGLPNCELYRIFFYDAEPFGGDSRHPITKRTVNFGKSDQFKFQHALFTHLKKQRKIALRLGFLKNSSKQWSIKPEFTKDIVEGKLKVEDLKANHLFFPFNQKAVDMKIGLDIATLAYKSQVGQIILIAGDSDFVPAAKFARREGVDFVLDPMLNPIDQNLHEHIDGLRTITDMTYYENREVLDIEEDFAE